MEDLAARAAAEAAQAVVNCTRQAEEKGHTEAEARENALERARYRKQLNEWKKQKVA